MFFAAPITHTALSWADEDDGQVAGLGDMGYWQHIARVLEKGGFDAAFFADTPAASDQYNDNQETPIRYGVVWPTHDPMPLVAIMAAATSHLGIGVTLSPNGTPPYLAHRRITTLDYLSGGRVGWNVVTGHMRAEYRALGSTMMEHDERYDSADEYLEICYRLWDSVQPGAIVKDKAAGVFALPEKIEKVRFKGKFYESEAIPAALPSKGGRPVIFQAGSSGRGMEFAIRHADAIFAIQPTLEAMKSFRVRFDDAARKQGKDPIGILFGMHYIIGSTDEEARRKRDRLRERLPIDAALSRFSGPLGIDASKLDPDQPIEEMPTNASRGMMEALAKVGVENGRKPTLRDAALQMGLSGGLPQLVGSPETIADGLEHYWRESGAMGFNLSAATKPGMIEDFVEHVVPILRKRGLVRGDYEGTTLRDNLR